MLSTQAPAESQTLGNCCPSLHELPHGWADDGYVQASRVWPSQVPRAHLGVAAARGSTVLRLTGNGRADASIAADFALAVASGVAADAVGAKAAGALRERAALFAVVFLGLAGLVQAVAGGGTIVVGFAAGGAAVAAANVRSARHRVGSAGAFAVAQLAAYRALGAGGRGIAASHGILRKIATIALAVAEPVAQARARVAGALVASIARILIGGDGVRRCRWALR